jgi:AraC-like DNA-binding protein
MKRLGWFKQLFEYRYFGRIFYLYIVSLMLLVVIITSAFYFYVEDTVTKNKYETDMQTLLQIKNNVEITNRFIANFCVNIYFNSSAVNLMRSRPDNINWNDIITDLKDISSSMISFAPYIHSVYVYNNSNNTYYSTYTGLGTITHDRYLEDVIRQYDHVPVLMPIVRKIKSKSLNKEVYKNIFSYFFYETTDKNGRFDGAVVVNVDPDWLMENLNSLNDDAYDEQSRFYLMAANREFVSSDKNAPEYYLDDLQSIYYDRIAEEVEKGVTSNMFPCSINDTEYMLSYIYLKDEDFILFKTQPYDSVYASINHVKVSLLIISAVVVIFSFFLSFFISDRIYRPFGKMLGRINGQAYYRNPDRKSIDELGFLEDSYIRSANEISLLRNKIDSADAIKYKYYLIQLLVNSSAVTDKEIEDINSSELFNINIYDPIMLIMLKLDSKHIVESTARSLSSVSDWLKSMLSETLSKYYINDIIDLENSYIVAILNAGEPAEREDGYKALHEEILLLQQKARQQFGFSFAAVIGDPVDSINGIAENFFLLQRHLAYRYIYGSDAIITTELIAENLNNLALNYPVQEEKKLVREIKAQNVSQIEIVLDDILRKIAKMSYNNLLISVIRLGNTIRNTVEEISRVNFKDIYADTVGDNPMQYSTIAELGASLLDLIKNGIAEDIVAGKHRKLAAAAKGIVLNSYVDPNLCLIGIADSLKISPNYLNHIYKNINGMSISDFITDYRLDKAAQLIESSNDSVYTIMRRVGIENESFFYKRFKEKFGTTPKNYLVGQKFQKLVGSE